MVEIAKFQRLLTGQIDLRISGIRFKISHVLSVRAGINGESNYNV